MNNYSDIVLDYGFIFNKMADVITVFDLELNIVWVSPSVKNLLGYDPNELIGKNVKILLTEESFKLSCEKLAEELEKENDPNVDKNRSIMMVLKEIRKDKKEIWVEVHVSAIRDELENVKYLLVVSRDVTDRIELQNSLKESEEKFRSIFDSTKDAIFIHDSKTGIILDVNEAMLKMYGYDDKKDVVGHDVSKFSAPEYTEERAFSLIKDARHGKFPTFEWLARKRDGSRFWVEVSLSSGMWEQNEYVIAVVRDITERKRLEKSLKEQMELFQTLAEVTSTGIGIYNLEKNYIYVNKASELITGYSKEEIIGKPFYFMVHPDHLEMVKQRGFRRLLGDKNLPLRYEIKIVTKDGTEKWVDFTAGQIMYQGKPAVVGTVFDITHLKNTERQLIEEKEKLSIILESVGDAIITTDLNGNITFVNKAAENLLSLSEEDIIGYNIENIIEFTDTASLPIENPVLACLKGEKTIEGYDCTLLVKNLGLKREVEYKATSLQDDKKNILGCVLVLKDIGERQKFLNAMQNAQKMEALSTLAAGIAHDFNNLLSGIFGFIDLAYARSKDSSIGRYLQMSLSSIERAKNLTNQLLTFAKGGEPRKKINNVKEFLKNTVNFALSGSNVKANFILEDGILAEFDENQLAQAIDNIVINAVQAMENGGEIEVALRSIYISKPLKGSLAPGEYAEIKIRDNGPGMPREILYHIFEPFFTTKKHGHGLGLATTYSIVKRHSGEILVESEQGKGTTFYIYLPVVRNKVNGERGSLTSVSEDKFKGDGVLLVVDDELLMQELLSEILRYYGFEVISFNSGEELIEFLKTTPQEIKKIKGAFFDITLIGGMSGIMAAKEAKKYIDVPMIVMSGYADEIVMVHPEKYGFVGSLPKPFKLEDVLKLLKSHFNKNS